MRFSTIAAGVAFLVAVGALLYVLLGFEAPREPVEIETTLRQEGGSARPDLRAEAPARGGIYAGVVVDAAGEPIADATVLLVAHGGPSELPRGVAPERPEDFDPATLPVIGYRTAAEGRTDPAGRFRIAADADQAIRVVAAYERGYMPSLQPVGGPTEDLRVQLDEAGQFIGHVVDAETGAPVGGADVALYLQQRANTPEGGVGERSRGRSVPLSGFAVAQRWVVETLGERVWGLSTQSGADAALHLMTDGDGTFRFGPIADEVQLEFVITHADYMWKEFDQQGPAGQARRTVVPPGEVVERTFPMDPGSSIAGVVVDEDGRGIPDVVLKVEHVVQYAQHWWYRQRQRITRTARDGSFRVGGLSYGPYNVQLVHPAFGVEWRHGVPEGAQDLRWEIENRGTLLVEVGDIGRPPRGVEAEVVLEAAEVHEDEPRTRRERVRLDADGRLRVERLRPGRYLAWVKAAGRASVPQTIEIRALEVTRERFPLGGGGRLQLLVLDVAGRAIDPTQVTLLAPEEAEAGEGGQLVPRAYGRFVTREGELDVRGVAPGRYRLEVSAPGFLPETTGVVEVAGDATTDAGVVRLREQAWLRIASILDADGRLPSTEVVITIQEGDDEPSRYFSTGQAARPVRPGTVTVRAEASDGTGFERTFEVADGETVEVDVRLR